jgi:AAA family ATP:ADP antiporter
VIAAPPVAGATPVASRSALERALCLFTDVQPGEGVTALVMFANVFAILCAYYFVKPLRDGWLASSDGRGLSTMEMKAYTSFAQSVVLIGVVSLYARLAARWSRVVLITRVTLFCMSNLAIFWLLQRGVFGDHVPGAAVAFYIWVGMFGVFVVSQFWAFAADLYTDERGRRMLPLIAIGATAGAATGALLTERIVKARFLGTGALVTAAGAALAASIALTAIADRRGATGHGTDGSRRRQTAAVPGGAAAAGGLALVLRHRYLLAVAAVMLLTHWVNTNGENVLFQVVQDALRRDMTAGGVTQPQAIKAFVREGTTAFYGSYFFWVNICALAMQALLASRLLRYGGFGLILLLLPTISLVAYSAMAFAPALLVVRVMKTAENSTSYSINNTAQQVLWLPTTAEMKYKAKPTIETLFLRLGDGLAALTVLAGVRMFGLPVRSFLLFNVVLTVVWFGAAWIVVREHARVRAGGPLR